MSNNITKVQFSINSQKLTGTLQYPVNIKVKLPSILFIHGWTSSETKYIDRAKPLVALGFTCLTFNMRGHGTSDGNLDQLTRADHLQDCIAAYDFLVSQPHVDQKRIGVVGSSYGGYMAVLLSQRRAIKWLALKCPANYPDTDFERKSANSIVEAARATKYRTQLLHASENLALSAASQFNNELLMIECERDEVIPKICLTNYVNVFAQNNVLTYRTIQGSNHSSSKPEWNQEFVGIVSEWFASKLT